MTDERGRVSPSSAALPESRDSHSSSPDPSLLTQVEALIADWREYADQLSAANTTTSLSFAAGVRKCADQLQPLLVLLVEQQRQIERLTNERDELLLDLQQLRDRHEALVSALRDIVQDAVGHPSDPLWIVRQNLVVAASAALAKAGA